MCFDPQAFKLAVQQNRGLAMRPKPSRIEIMSLIIISAVFTCVALSNAQTLEVAKGEVVEIADKKIIIKRVAQEGDTPDRIIVDTADAFWINRNSFQVGDQVIVRMEELEDGEMKPIYLSKDYSMLFNEYLVLGPVPPSEGASPEVPNDLTTPSPSPSISISPPEILAPESVND